MIRRFIMWLLPSKLTCHTVVEGRKYIMALWRVKVYCQCHKHGYGFCGIFLYCEKHLLIWSFQVYVVLCLLNVDFYCLPLSSSDFTGTKSVGYKTPCIFGSSYILFSRNFVHSMRWVSVRTLYRVETISVYIGHIHTC